MLGSGVLVTADPLAAWSVAGTGGAVDGTEADLPLAAWAYEKVGAGAGDPPPDFGCVDDILLEIRQAAANDVDGLDVTRGQRYGRMTEWPGIWTGSTTDSREEQPRSLHTPPRSLASRCLSQARCPDGDWWICGVWPTGTTTETGQDRQDHSTDRTPDIGSNEQDVRAVKMQSSASFSCSMLPLARVTPAAYGNDLTRLGVKGNTISCCYVLALDLLTFVRTAW